MNVVLTGATGLIGSSLLHQLSAEHNLTYLLNSSLPFETSSNGNSVQQDLSLGLDYELLPKKIDAVIHLAQSRKFRDFPTASADIFSINTHATFRLAEYARQAGAKTFIFASTGGVYASKISELNETDMVYPSGFYASSKYAAEVLLSAYTSFFRVVILRFFFVYGPAQRNMLIPNLIGKIIGSDVITIEGKPGLHINPIHVEDAVRVFSPVLSTSVEGILNVAGDEVVSMTELVNLISKVSNKSAHISYIDEKRSGNLVADNTKMKHLTGVYPRISLRQGLSELIKLKAF
ncbi:MAG: NAD(P)-dependent oxidoreductase [Anaerolineales bacterium]|nr:NAD(P)-dependent oxidoreductase [Anaerolineales bacterium]